MADDRQVAAARARIAALDRRIVEAVNARIELVASLRRHKEAHGIPFHDPEQEERLRAALAAANDGPLTDEGLRELVDAVLGLTKRELGRLDRG